MRYSLPTYQVVVNSQSDLNSKTVNTDIRMTSDYSFKYFNQVTCSSTTSCATHQQRSAKENKEGTAKGQNKLSRKNIQEGRNSGGGRRQGTPEEENLMKEWY